MTLTKTNLIDSVYEQVAIPKYQSSWVVEALLEIMKKTMESGEDIMISGFGKFCVKDKKERKGRNPDTGSDMKLRARRVVVFKCARVLREKMNGKR